MTKPTVFFSHSSRDKKAILFLRQAFLDKTGGTIDVFMSSDGESIPLGHNWVYKVQEGLENASLMLVFLSPNSVDSKWVYFESGFSYSKKMRVVPIAIFGTDLNRLGPPLSLLQGFNITNEDGLNNLIALANEAFGHRHRLSFSSQDYKSIEELDDSPQITGDWGWAEIVVDEIEFWFRSSHDWDNKLMLNAAQTFYEIGKSLLNNKVEHFSGKNSIALRGISIHLGDGNIRIQVAPSIWRESISVLNDILSVIAAEQMDKIKFYVNLVSTVDVIEDSYKISALLSKEAISIEAADKVTYKGAAFNCGHYISSSGSRGKRFVAIQDMLPLAADKTQEILDMLCKRQVIRFQGKWNADDFEVF